MPFCHTLFQLWLSGIEFGFKHLKLIQIRRHFQFRISSVRSGEKSKPSLTFPLSPFWHKWNYSCLIFVEIGNKFFLSTDFNILFFSQPQCSNLVISNLPLLTTKIIGNYHTCCILKFPILSNSFPPSKAFFNSLVKDVLMFFF